MRYRMITMFFVGVLTCAIVISAGIGAISALTDDVQAQGGGTWDTIVWTSDRAAGVSPLDEFRAWVNELPESCDVQTIGDGISLTVYYRCP